MMNRFRGLLLSGLLVFGAADAGAVAPIHECDRIGANPDDYDRVAEGVFWSVLNGTAAAKACAEALEQHAEEPRFIYQYGRALARLARNEEAISYLSQAAEAGHLMAYTTLGSIFHYVTKNYAEADHWYRQGAELGSASAQVHLGELIRAGLGVEKDPRRAYDWYKKAADQGYALGESRIGELYDQGLGVAADPGQAAEWYGKAAEKQLPQAQFFLGRLYRDGRGVAADIGEALHWMTRAANQGFGRAQIAVAELHERRGDGDDLKQAYYWFTIASKHRSKDIQASAVEATARLKDSLSASERREIRSRASKWRRRLVPAPMRPAPAG